MARRRAGDIPRQRFDLSPVISETVSYLSTEGHRDRSHLLARLLDLGGIDMSERKSATGEYLDARTMGAMLNINRESVYRAIARGELQAIRVGRSIRLPRAQLDALLIDGTCDARSQAEQDEW